VVACCGAIGNRDFSAQEPAAINRTPEEWDAKPWAKPPGTE
jgi:hypothetical protein